MTCTEFGQVIYLVYNSVIFQELDHCSELPLSIHIRIPSPLIISSLNQAQAKFFQSLDLLIHAPNFKGNVVQAWTVRDQLIVPSARFTDGLD